MERENREVLSLVQALTGCVSWNMRQVTLELLPQGGTFIRFVLERDDPDDREEIDEIVADFADYAGGKGELRVEIICDPRPFRELEQPGRVVYCRKER